MAISALPPVPNDLPKVITWLKKLRNWLHFIMQAPEVNYVIFQQLHVEPEKPLDGMVVYADGTDWEPNDIGTQGLYRYEADTGLWSKLDN